MCWLGSWFEFLGTPLARVRAWPFMWPPAYLLHVSGAGLMMGDPMGVAPGRV